MAMDPSTQVPTALYSADLGTFVDSTTEIPDYNPRAVEYQLNPTYTRDDAFYAATSLGNDKPLETYYQLMEDLETKGESETINALRYQYQSKKDIERGIFLENIIADPSFTKQEKKYILNKQLQFNNPEQASLRSMYLEGLTAKELEENPVLTDAQVEGLTYKVHAFKSEADFMKSVQKIANMVNGSEPLPDNAGKVLDGNMFDQIMETYWDPVIAEPLAAYEALVLGLVPMIADWVGTGYIYATDEDMKSVTQAREKARKVIQDAGHEDFIKAWRKIAGFFGVEDEDIEQSLVMTGLGKLDEGIGFVANKLTPDDPEKSKVPLEILTAFLVPMVRKGYKAGKMGYLRVQDPNAYQLVKLLESPTKYDKAGAIPIPIIEDTSSARRRGLDELGFDVPMDSTFDATVMANKSMAKELANVFLEDNTGTSRKAFKYDLDTFIAEFAAPEIFGKNKASNFLDITPGMRELHLVQRQVNRETVFNPFMVDEAPRKVWTQELVGVVNKNLVDADVSMNASKTKLDIQLSGTEASAQLRYVKSDGTNFLSLREVTEAATVIKKNVEALNQTSDKGAGKVYVEALDSLGDTIAIKEVISTDHSINLNTMLANPNDAFVAQGSYKVLWQRKADFFDEVKDLGEGFGKTPWADEITSIGWLNTTLNKARQVVFDNNPLRDWFVAFGKSDKALERQWTLAHMRAERAMKSQLEILGREIGKQTGRIDAKQGRQYRSDLKKLYEEQRNKTDLMTTNEIYQVLDYAAEGSYVKGLQDVLKLTREIDRFAYRILNNFEVSRAVEAGFKDYIDIRTPNTGGLQRIMVQDTFVFETLTKEGKISLPEIWDTQQGKPITWTPTEANNSRVPVEQFLWESGNPTRKIVKLRKPFRDDMGNLYDYAVMSPEMKLTGVPDWIVPTKTGHYSRISEGNYFVKAYPKVIKRNGIITTAELGKASVIHKDYANTVAMFKTETEAKAWLNNNINKVKELDSTKYEFEIPKAEELTNLENNIEMNIIEQSIARPAKAANEHIYNAIYADPLTSFVLTNSRLGTQAYIQPVLQQMKARWKETYKGKVDMGALDNNGLPTSPNNIKAYPGKETIFRQAAAEWNQMHHFEHAYHGHYGARGLAWIADVIGDITDRPGFLRLSKMARVLERNPNVVADIPRQLATTFYITFAFIGRNLTLQPIGIFGPMLVGGHFPTVLANTIAGAHYKINQRMGVKKYDKYNESIWDYSYQQEGLTKALDKAGQILSKEDHALIIKAMEDSGYGIIGEHYFAKGLFSAKPASLSNTLLDSSLGRNVKKFNDFYSQIGFEAGEYLNRLGMWHAARALWVDNNPGKNWRSKKALAEITYDANQLAGSMIKENAYGFQKIPLVSLITQFGAFSMKASESIWNKGATPFTPTQRAYLAGYNLAVFGVRGGLIYGIGDAILDWLNANDMSEIADTLDNKGLAYLGVNRLLDVVNPSYNEEGRLIKSSADIPAVYSPFGVEAWGVYGQMIKVAQKIADMEVDNYSAAPSLKLIERFQDTGALIGAMFNDPNMTISERLYESMILALRLTSGGNRAFEYFMYNKANEKLNKMGQSAGYPSSMNDRILGLFSIPSAKVKQEFDGRKAVKGAEADVKEAAKLFYQQQMIKNSYEMDFNEVIKAFQAINWALSYSENEQNLFWEEVVRLDQMNAKSRKDTLLQTLLDRRRLHAKPVYSDQELKLWRAAIEVHRGTPMGDDLEKLYNELKDLKEYNEEE